MLLQLTTHSGLESSEQRDSLVIGCLENGGRKSALTAGSVLSAITASTIIFRFKGDYDE